MGQAVTRDGFPCWIDLGARDVDAALTFYAEVVGWEAGERSGAEYGGYAMWFRDGIPAAGIGPLREGGSPAWTIYLATTDIDATLETVTRNGGRTLTPAMVIGPLGRMAVVTDPTGPSSACGRPATSRASPATANRDMWTGASHAPPTRA